MRKVVKWRITRGVESKRKKGKKKNTQDNGDNYRLRWMPEHKTKRVKKKMKSVENRKRATMEKTKKKKKKREK